MARGLGPGGIDDDFQPMRVRTRFLFLVASVTEQSRHVGKFGNERGTLGNMPLETCEVWNERLGREAGTPGEWLFLLQVQKSDRIDSDRSILVGSTRIDSDHQKYMQNEREKGNFTL